MRKLPLAGHSISHVDGEARFTLTFDDPAESTLFIEGSFVLLSGDDVQDEYEPPCQEWVRDVLWSLANVRVLDAKYDRHGNLIVFFEDGRELRVNDGPFENWHYRNSFGAHAIGGVGRVVTWGGLRP